MRKNVNLQEGSSNAFFPRKPGDILGHIIHTTRWHKWIQYFHKRFCIFYQFVHISFTSW